METKVSKMEPPKNKIPNKGDRLKGKTSAESPSCKKETTRTLSHDVEFTSLQADVFKVLADPVRLQIIDLLTQGPLCVCEINPFFEKSQAAVSKHLKALLNAGIIALKPEGTKNIYSLRIPQVLDVVHSGEEYLKIHLKSQEEHIRRLNAQ